MFVWKDQKINEKEAEDGPILKNLFIFKVRRGRVNEKDQGRPEQQWMETNLYVASLGIVHCKSWVPYLHVIGVRG